MNTKQSFALAALAASMVTSANASAQYETRGFSAPLKQEILSAYQRNDLVKIDQIKMQVSDLNKVILRLEMEKYGPSFVNQLKQIPVQVK